MWTISLLKDIYFQTFTCRGKIQNTSVNIWASLSVHATASKCILMNLILENLNLHNFRLLAINISYVEANFTTRSSGIPCKPVFDLKVPTTAWRCVSKELSCLQFYLNPILTWKRCFIIIMVGANPTFEVPKWHTDFLWKLTGIDFLCTCYSFETRIKHIGMIKNLSKCVLEL